MKSHYWEPSGWILLLNEVLLFSKIHEGRIVWGRARNLHSPRHGLPVSFRQGHWEGQSCLWTFCSAQSLRRMEYFLCLKKGRLFCKETQSASDFLLLAMWHPQRVPWGSSKLRDNWMLMADETVYEGFISGFSWLDSSGSIEGEMKSICWPHLTWKPLETWNLTLVAGFLTLSWIESLRVCECCWIMPPSFGR